MGELSMRAHQQITRAAADVCENRIDRVGLGQQVSPMCQQRGAGASECPSGQGAASARSSPAAVLDAVKPPPALASLAMKEAPATTDGSSITMGTKTSRPLTWKLRAIPSGKRVRSDHVLDHVVGGIERQAVL